MKRRRPKVSSVGLTNQEYIMILKSCGMCTKKWTYAKIKKFDILRRGIIYHKYLPKKQAKVLTEKLYA